MIRFLPLLLLSAPVAAAGFQDTVSLDRAVAAFAGHAIGDEGGARTAVDSRLRLAQCPTVALSWRTPSHDAVVIACSGPDWRIYVPMRTVPAVGLSGATVIQPPTQRAEAVIKRGDPVVIEAGSPGFSISREGTALTDAAPGARFTVRVENAKAPVQAVAVAQGRATLPGWGE